MQTNQETVTMANICPVCNKTISFWDAEFPQGVEVHSKCEGEFNEHTEKYLLV